jgi:hypothetical protein
MAEITRVAAPSFDSSNPSLKKTTGPVAGEAIAAGDWCYMKSDGKWWKATGAAATAPAKAKGMAALDASAGEAVTILGVGWRWKYGAGLTPGAQYFLSGTVPGGLADAASVGGTAVLAFAVSDTDIEVTGVQN